MDFTIFSVAKQHWHYTTLQIWSVTQNNEHSLTLRYSHIKVYAQTAVRIRTKKMWQHWIHYRYTRRLVDKSGTRCHIDAEEIYKLPVDPSLSFFCSCFLVLSLSSTVYCGLNHSAKSSFFPTLDSLSTHFSKWV